MLCADYSSVRSLLIAASRVTSAWQSVSISQASCCNDRLRNEIRISVKMCRLVKCHVATCLPAEICVDRQGSGYSSDRHKSRRDRGIWKRGFFRRAPPLCARYALDESVIGRKQRGDDFAVCCAQWRDLFPMKRSAMFYPSVCLAESPLDGEEGREEQERRPCPKPCIRTGSHRPMAKSASPAPPARRPPGCGASHSRSEATGLF
jgi:hypothetical protein